VDRCADTNLIPNVLSIAGSDPGGGAGIQADIKTFAALRCHGLTAITALTVQNSQGVFDIHLPPPSFVMAEIDQLFADSTIAAVKIGMLASPDIANAVADVLAQRKPPFIVLDPVLSASTGAPLASNDLAIAIIEKFAPLVSLITPNLAEAARLCGRDLPTDIDDMRNLAEQTHRLGFRSVLLKGGHLAGASSDDLFFDGIAAEIYTGRRVTTRHTHGTGCTLSSAIAAYVALGLELNAAIRSAKNFVTRALETAEQLDVGKGAGPLNHFHALW
jgi:hydroxymethylpyrimidine/phosphomethylpyrimidine kinase